MQNASEHHQEMLEHFEDVQISNHTGEMSMPQFSISPISYIFLLYFVLHVANMPFSARMNTFITTIVNVINKNSKANYFDCILNVYRNLTAIFQQKQTTADWLACFCYSCAWGMVQISALYGRLGEFLCIRESTHGCCKEAGRQTWWLTAERGFSDCCLVRG